MAEPAKDVFLIYGKNGWIGGKLQALLTEQGKEFHLGEARLQNREHLERELDEIKPTRVLCAAGVTGRPNVDWCESHKLETIRTNVIGALNIADVCNSRNIHCTLYATGCIFEYDAEHTIGGKGFTEEDKPNFDGSFYSATKGMVEPLLSLYDTLCILRVRMPISDDLSPRNFITKIVKYDKVVNIPNSMTVLTDLLPASIIMSEKNLTGIYNFCNPGAISHNEILDLYKKHIDPDYTYTNFTEEEQNKILEAKRSNNTLDCSKLVNDLAPVEIKDIHTAMDGVFQRMKVNLTEEGILPDRLPKRARTS
uniref:RmlD-like substrate binding domain-containing protein n=1 Tax=Fibrocapsa japonica TaxID=94617 RepID=A0A6U1NBW8_9STRA|eukprot:CAMPEP_0113934080 /NCGR_PEP_ID=MMETSP1339-20121228/1400_1 /TAXON_ID=94617 /ORGANISM="Fibrocapsa japonica" /LENGTH=308 /DNA_ID=CAMNT_0000935711 /DNA_START=73 /DNA_END=999 /DNA_ORIENTATION=+ /assembly_acc=CAM_ASM_000762